MLCSHSKWLNYRPLGKLAERGSPKYYDPSLAGNAMVGKVLNGKVLAGPIRQVVPLVDAIGPARQHCVPPFR
ncbi:hypothetical protein SH139x_004426 [Planctomycetaceae bacterium SH139]